MRSLVQILLPQPMWFVSLVVMTSACHAEDHESDSRTNRHLFCGFIAQSVEQRTENPCVVGSIPTEATKYCREVAQLGSALGLGPRGRKFESCLLDQNSIKTLKKAFFMHYFTFLKFKIIY